jgi:hypothetical protein
MIEIVIDLRNWRLSEIVAMNMNMNREEVEEGDDGEEKRWKRKKISHGKIHSIISFFLFIYGNYFIILVAYAIIYLFKLNPVHCNKPIIHSFIFMCLCIRNSSIVIAFSHVQRCRCNAVKQQLSVIRRPSFLCFVLVFLANINTSF